MEKTILIVGAGPTGLVLASQLKQYGVNADIIDKRTSFTSYSKALSVSAASLKVFHGMGIIDKILNAGNPMQDIYIHFNGKRTMHINKRYLPGPYNYFLSIPQPITEEILKNHHASLGGSIQLGMELKAIKRKENGKILVELFNSYIGQANCIEYDYVIGCDGSRSAVRELSNINFSGRDYGMHFNMADVQWSGKGRSSLANYFVDDKGFLIEIPMKNNLTRLVMKVEGEMPTDPAFISKEQVQEVVNRCIPERPQIDKIVWTSGAAFYNRIAETCYSNNILLAGDAMHLFSPIGGQGMNTGIQDAFNLAWRLAACIKGHAKTSILETYAIERMHVVENTRQKTDWNTELIASRQEKGREKFSPLFASRNSIKQELPFEFSGFSADYQNLYAHDKNQKIAAGQHVPYWKISHPQCQDSYDIPRLGKYVVLLKESDITKKWRELEALFPHYINLAGFKDPDISFDSYVVIRPDAYIAGTGKVDEPNDCLKYLANYIV